MSDPTGGGRIYFLDNAPHNSTDTEDTEETIDLQHLDQEQNPRAPTPPNVVLDIPSTAINVWAPGDIQARLTELSLQERLAALPLSESTDTNGNDSSASPVEQAAPTVAPVQEHEPWYPAPTTQDLEADQLLAANTKSDPNVAYGPDAHPIRYDPDVPPPGLTLGYLAAREYASHDSDGAIDDEGNMD
jgi:hypothetical protein